MAAEPGKTRVGFIGLGIMGAAMAQNIAKAGFSLTAWNRKASKAEKAFPAGGASIAESPQDVASVSDVTITMVTDTPDVEEVILGPKGVIHGAAPGSVVIDMSTISPKATQEIAAKLSEEKGVSMLDAPVSGGDVGAQKGTLSIMVGGDEATFNFCLPIFQAMGKKITLVGWHGAGQTTKLCNQIAVAVNNMAMAEALILAAASGLDPGLVLEAISGGAAGSWQLSNLGPRILKGDFAPGFMVKLMQKDLKLVLEAARNRGLTLPGVSNVHQLFNYVEDGGAEWGTQALIRAYEKLAGVEARTKEQ